MTPQAMYDAFRGQFSDLAVATDARTKDSCFEFDDGPAVQPLWFECLADELNDRMAAPEYRKQIVAVFMFMDACFRAGDADTQRCIDVCFVENLFWNVPRSVSRKIWPLLPPELRRLYCTVFRYTSDPF